MGGTKDIDLETDAQKGLFLALRERRNELAAEKGVPPYLIFTNVYLDGFDHYVMEMLRFPYIRYMDDMILFSNGKADLKVAFRMCEKYLEEELHLAVKPGSVLLNSRMHGLPFWGFRIFPNLLRLKAVNVKRLVAKIKLRQYQFKNNQIDEAALCRSVQSTFAFAGIADSFQTVKRICDGIG